MTFWERTATKKADRKAEDGNPMMEDRCWEQALFPEELPDAFTDRVMLALEGIEIESVQGTRMPPKPSGRIDPHDTSIAAQAKRERTANRSSLLKVGAAVAAAAVLAGSTLLYTQPTLADMVRSLFAKDSIVDNGMKNAQETGVVQISGASATDQGYTLRINEVIADSTRLIIGIDVYDAKGNALDGQVDYSSTADFHIYLIQNGQFVGDVSGPAGKGGNPTTNRMEFQFNRPVLADKLQLGAHIHDLKLNRKTIKGDWLLETEVDLTKANAQTLLTPINQTYETPGGIQIHMQGASRTPSGGSLEFTTKLTPAAAERAVNGPSGFHKIIYHFEDEQGNRLESNDDFHRGLQFVPDRWSGVSEWFHTFTNFAYDKQKIRFVLDSYVIREKSEASVTLDPARTSAEHPALFEDLGDKLLFEGLEIGPLPNADRTKPRSNHAFIRLTGTMINEMAGETWVAIDENGKEYSMEYRGAFSTDPSGKSELSSSYFVIDGLDHMPKQLTLKRLIVNHRYQDAHWSFVIPQTGTRGVIPE